MHYPQPQHKKGYWYIRIKGRDYYLGKDQSEAIQSANVLLIEKLYRPTSPNNFTIGEVLRLYIKDIGPDIAPVTLRNYTSYCAMISGRIGKYQVQDFTKHVFSRLLDRMAHDGNAAGTIKAHRRILLAALKYAESIGIVPDGTFHTLDVVSVPRRAKRPARVTPINIQDIEAVKDILSETLYDVLRLEYLTGMRPCELLSLRKCDFISTGSGLWKVVLENHKTAWKTGSPLVKFIGPRAQEILEKYIVKAQGLTAPLFISPRGLKLTPEIVTGTLVYLRRKHPDRFPPKFTQYQCRHRAGTDSRREAGLEGAQAYLGHSCRATSEIYAEVDYSLAEMIARKIG